MLNSRFGYSVKRNSFKGLNINCIQNSNIIRITYYSYSYSGTILNPNIIRIRIRPNIYARILFVFVFAHSEKTNIIPIRIQSKFWFRIIFVFVFGPKNSIRSPLSLIVLNDWSTCRGTEMIRFPALGRISAPPPFQFEKQMICSKMRRRDLVQVFQGLEYDPFQGTPKEWEWEILWKLYHANLVSN